MAGGAGLAKLQAARLSVLSNSLLVLAKLAVGLWMGSVAVISEAIHSGLDLAAAGIAYFSIKKANKPPDEQHPYGHGKLENVSGTIEAVLIFAAALYIIYEAVLRLFRGGEVEKLGLGALVMAFSAGVNWLISAHLFKIARETDSVALAADAWHLRTDVYTSAGVLLGLGLMAVTGWAWLDAVVAIIVALLILKAAWDLTKEAFVDIIDTRLPEEEEHKIIEILEKHRDYYLEYHQLRSRKAGSERFVDLHLVVPQSWSISRVHEITDHLEQRIQEVLPNTHAVIHVEPCTHGSTRCFDCDDCELEGRQD
ncbi:MAG: cation diffusion facilitator family transporter [Bacillota bacterium]